MTIHTIKSGDSVYSIARQYGVPPTRIISDNLLDNPSKLTVGGDLIILYPTETHTVRGGETLNSIAREYGVSENELLKNNPILSGVPSIYPGQVLNISYGKPPLGSTETNGYAYTSIDEETLRKTLPYLTYLSVFSYGIRYDGTLIEAEDDGRVILLAKEYGTVPLLVLTSINEGGNFSSETVQALLASTDATDNLVNNVARTVKEKGYGGVDFDFEYLPAEYAEKYAELIEKIKEKLSDGYTVFVSLAPKTKRDQVGLLYEGHDYGELGEKADRALLMTYEWGYKYGPPIPISPLNEVRRVIDYALSEIEAKKLFLGVPSYGYDWSLPYLRGESEAETLPNLQAEKRAEEKNAEIKYDRAADAPYYTYYDRPEIYSDAVEHIVWFENARSTEAMLKLVYEYGLEGFGVWNIMNYYPALWSIANSLYKIVKK